MLRLSVTIVNFKDKFNGGLGTLVDDDFGG